MEGGREGGRCRQGSLPKKKWLRRRSRKRGTGGADMYTHVYVFGNQNDWNKWENEAAKRQQEERGRGRAKEREGKGGDDDNSRVVALYK